MNVELVWITPNAEKLIAYIARVSNPENQDNPDYVGLIRYMLNNKHWSPFDQVSVSFEVVTSRAISAQIIRHKSMFFQEFCVTGDTMIKLHRPAGAVYQNTIKQLFNLQKTGKPLPFARVYDGKQFTKAKIKEVFYTGEKPVFKITLASGKTIACTKEHKFLTRTGYDTLENIVGLTVHATKAVMTKHGVIGTNGIPCYQDYDWMKNAKEQSILNKTGLGGIARHANVTYHTIRKWLKIHGLQYSKREVAQYTEIWNKGKFGYINRSHSIETINKMRIKARKGPASNLWKGGANRKERLKIADWCATIRAEKLKLANYQCLWCQSNHKLELDHILPVYSHPELAYNFDNIQVLCSRCHDKKHNIAGDQKIWKEKAKGNTLVARWEKIESIEYLGTQETFDLEVYHESHNYVANNIIVHNSQRYSKVVEFEPIEIRRQASKNRQSSEDVFDPILDCGDHQIPASELIDDVLRYIEWTYEKLLELDVAKECARMILPLTAQTTIYMTGTLRSWIHYIELRNDSHAQKEHRLIAIAIEEELRKHFPVVFAALDQIKETERKEKELIKLLVDNDKADIDLLKMLLGVVHE